MFGFLIHPSSGLRRQYERDRDAVLSNVRLDGSVSEADLVHLPSPVQRYLRVAGVVGRPRVLSFRAQMHGRIRSGPGARWMPLAADQYNVVHPAARLFYFNASMFGVPVQGYHRYVGSSASMKVKAAGLVTVASAEGVEMTQSETVTLFNDMCILAPATLIDPAIGWEALDASTVRAGFTNAGHTIHAELHFNAGGELVSFTSDDRYQSSPDSKSLTRVRWSTPIRNYRSFRGARLASRGEGWWHGNDGEFAYIELTIDDVEYNVTSLA